MTSSIGDKILGIILILFGALCFLSLFYSQRFVLNDYSFFFARYFKVILATYCGLIFILTGISFFTGLLVPRHKANSYEKSKTNMFMSITVLPFWLFLLTVTYVSFNSNEIRTYKILGILLSAIIILFCLKTFIKSLKTFKGFHRKKWGKGQL